MFRFLFKFLATIILSLLLIVVVVSCFQHFQSRRYSFPEPKPFSGKHLYNPYKDVDTIWQKCNFHAHANAWGGTTDGNAQTGKDLLEKYCSMNYDVPCISDYHSINPEQNTTDSTFVPVYEHGHNLFKAHRLALGSTNVSYYDVSLLHTLHDRQYVIQRLRHTSPYIAVAHPKFGGGHTLDDFKWLTGYELIEVLNHYRLSDKYWDIALSAGKPVWIIADDDCHNITKPEETGVKWTMVGDNTSTGKNILDNLVKGNAYGVDGTNAENDNYLESVTTDSMAVVVKLKKKAKEIRLVGQNGLLRASILNSDHIKYIFAPEDTYVRAEIKNKKTKMYLNPIFRYDGKTTPQNTFAAQYSLLGTWLMRLIVLNVLFWSVAGYRFLFRKIWGIGRFF